MNPSPDLRLAELFVRYWDNALTAAEAEELETRLATDPAAREWFQVLTQQAVAAADMRAARPEQARASETAPPAVPAHAPESQTTGRRWNRRRVLGYLGGGVAASVGAVALGRWLWSAPAQPTQQHRYVRLGSVRGDVTIVAADGTVLPTDGPVPPGSTVTTARRSASAVLFYPDGSNVALTEDSIVTLGASDDRLRLDRGVLAADVRPPMVGRSPLTLETAETVLSSSAGFITTLYQAARITEVGVQRGAINVSAPTGRSLGEVRGGELLTVGSDGGLQRQAIRDTSDRFTPELTRALVAGWDVGSFTEIEKRPVVVPTYWFDPYHQRHMYQIRSDKQWVRGFFRLQPGSEIVVRYRVRETGPGQLCFCVRTPDIRSPETGMLEWNGLYEKSPPGSDSLQTIRVSARAMRDDKGNKHAPKFDVPWIGFLFIFNTYERDLGLQIADFRVTPPGPAGGNPE